ncbi:MAG: hypothetical protein CTY16_01090 [Methylobacter sp.]|nr:MAG: hypothetical protein CTY16_01090 [Methylobacter sp.]
MINKFNHVQHHLRMTRKASANLLKIGMTGTVSEWSLEENVTAETEDQEEPGCLRGIVKNVMVIIGVVVATPIVFLGVMYMLDKNGVDLSPKVYKPPLTQAELFKKNAPPEMADCSLSVFNKMKIVRCPNSTTSTQYVIRKNTNQNVVVIDNKNHP